MLEVGNRGMTVEEEKIHFVLWRSKAPLLIDCDITKMSKSTFDILMNPEVIAINQEPLGGQGKKIETVQPKQDDDFKAVIKEVSKLYVAACTGEEEQIVN